MSADLIEIVTEGNTRRLRYHWHPGQWRAMESTKRFVLALAGTQSGKTATGPPWLYREIQRKGPGDYLVVTPTYPLLNLKALPEFLRLFKQMLDLGDFVGSPSRRFTFSEAGNLRTFGRASEVPTQVFFGHASDPDSLESATAKACWLDEAGQKKFKLQSWEAIQRRLSIHQGRALITTTPYDLGWLKQKLWDAWENAKHNHPEIDVVQFDSVENPAFPQAEFERARRELPKWKFDLFYRARFTRPAGLIYDSFDSQKHVVPRFAIPEHWPRYVGLDFGSVNTAAVFFAEELDATKQPTGRLYLYREYSPGKSTPKERVAGILKDEPRIPDCVGGSASEDEWRQGFAHAGLPVREPDIKDVEVGIDRVYGTHARGEILVFSDCVRYLEQKLTYSRELDDRGEPTEKIEDKETFHLLDAERYIIGYLRPGVGAWDFTLPEESISEVWRSARGVFATDEEERDERRRR